MKLIAPEAAPTMDTVSGTHISSRGQSFTYGDALAVEHQLEIFINDHLAFEVVCTPTELPELVLGRLLSEGIIMSTDEVELVYLCPEGNRARVFLPGRAVSETQPLPERVSTCCAGNRTVADLFRTGETPARLRPIPYERQWIFDLARAFKTDTPLYAATHGTHSCLIMRGGALLHRSEDLGRHNALDKVLGWALAQGIPLAECILYTSGRVPVDMVKKVIWAGVPIFASKAMPTRESVALAREFGLTLIGAARADSMVLF